MRALKNGQVKFSFRLSDFIFATKRVSRFMEQSFGAPLSQEAPGFPCQGRSLKFAATFS